MPVNITSIKTSSNGVWQGDNPLDYAFPLLIVQITVVLFVSRSLALLFKPLRQPKVIAEIVGGILLGPSALGRNKSYLHRIFPSWSTPTLESVASIGLLFFLFLVGLELDLNSIRRSGKRAFSIAACGISLPFVSGIGVAIVLRKTVDGADKVGFAQFLVFMGVALSITAFPVLARILAELKLLTTRVGETAMAAAAFNDLAAWILLALAIALAGNGADGGDSKSPLVSVWVLLSGAGFVAFMMVVISPVMKRVAQRCSAENEAVNEVYICLTLACVMVSGFVTDFIGIHSIFGAFVFGLTIPKSGNFAERLIERIEDFVLGLLLPLYFASSGLKTNVTKVLNDEIFAILVLMALFTTFITTPLVMAIYKPARGIATKTIRKLGDMSSHSKDKNVVDQLRVLACIHGPSNIPSIISLIESTRSTKTSLLKVFIMHLVELTERSSSIIMVQRARKNGFPFFNRFNRDQWYNRLAGAFQGYSQLGRVIVRSTTAISSLSTMHEDICHVAEEKRVTMIILPFHKHWRMEVDEENENEEHEVLENAGHEWRAVNQRLLKNAPCSVGVLVDRGYGLESKNVGPDGTVTQRICIVFFGGPDDREALELGKKMAEHPAVAVTVVRFVEQDGGLTGNNFVLRQTPNKSTEENYSFSIAKMNRQKEQELDEKAMEEFRSKCGETVKYIEKGSSNVVEEVIVIGENGDYDLIIVGKGRFPSTMVAQLAEREAEHAELGPIGDILTSSIRHKMVSSVLVIQQHDVALTEDSPMYKVKVHDENVAEVSSNRHEISIANDNVV
ncbi:cation/H(+) antiporter 20-like [Cicer arietinum]|uniref:Cation/H(+) antiporter 20-like n=1 Tax=Cicer arietinum TaxID=3827 RepID=A0A1S2XSW9_CICAR|nr:cation/H(+) antiporter 20-like [Cicer arietinum]